MNSNKTPSRVCSSHSQNKLRTLILSHLPIVCLIGLSIFMVGCGTISVTRTVGVAGLKPVTADHVVLFESGKVITNNYEVVGTVAISQLQQNVKPAHKRMKKIAAQMGGDAVVEVKLGLMPNNKKMRWIYSGKVVKWIAPGAAPQPHSTQFVVAVLPIAKDPEAKGNQTEIANAAYDGASSFLEFRGYWVLPNESALFKGYAGGGLEELKLLSDDQLRQAGSSEADYILELTFTKQDQMHFIIWGNANVWVRARLMDKSTRQIIYEGGGRGSSGVGWILNMASSNLKRVMAAGYSAAGALMAIKPIHSGVEPW